jgi:hypothetical protein
MGDGVGEVRTLSGTAKAVENMAIRVTLISERVGPREWKPEKELRGRTPG